ncbi:MAG: DNA-3-methyladenine glycosylase I [Cryomorphaceae bacterium]
MESIDTRCPWCLGSDRYKAYHDLEWGRPLRDEQKMFEYLILETFQAGLSWITILNKRDNFREAFFDFNADKIARMDDKDVDRLMQNAGIIRNKQKIQAAIHNAKVLKAMHHRDERLVDVLWSYLDGKPLNMKRTSMEELPAVTDLAVTISKDLKKLGFKFIGPTTMYAHMQASGMVNDHLVSCPAYEECLE